VKPLILIASAVLALTPIATAQDWPEAFKTGPAIEAFGPWAAVDGAKLPDPEIEYRVAFDIAKGAKDGALNRRFETVARFINQLAGSGVPAEHIQPAIVVHGSAALDLLQPAKGETNPQAALVEALLDNGAQIIVCGQTAAYRGFDKDDLLPGVMLSVSAMTAHAELAREGYTPNPF